MKDLFSVPLMRGRRGKSGEILRYCLRMTREAVRRNPLIDVGQSGLRRFGPDGGEDFGLFKDSARRAFLFVGRAAVFAQDAFDQHA